MANADAVPDAVYQQSPQDFENQWRGNRPGSAPQQENSTKAQRKRKAEKHELKRREASCPKSRERFLDAATPEIALELSRR